MDDTTKKDRQPMKKGEQTRFPGRNDEAMTLLNGWLNELDAARMACFICENIVKKKSIPKVAGKGTICKKKEKGRMKVE